MKIINCKKDYWGESVNIIDDNDSFVGYDLGQDCCEHAGYYFVQGKPTELETSKDGDAPEPECLDSLFFVSIESQDLKTGEEDYFEGEAAMFELSQDWWLVLFNCHNGYYSHCWQSGIHEVQKHGGSL